MVALTADLGAREVGESHAAWKQHIWELQCHHLNASAAAMCETILTAFLVQKSWCWRNSIPSTAAVFEAVQLFVLGDGKAGNSASGIWQHFSGRAVVS